MAKKRKSRGAPASDGPRDYDPKDDRIGPVDTYEDVANSEDEFFINRDKVLLDEGPEAKRRRKIEEEDAFLEPSDEEILGYDDEEEDAEDDQSEDEEADDASAARQRSEANHTAGEGADEDEDEVEGGWGSSKRDYYDADNIETEADALEEEAEAKRLQKKKLQKMSEADFGFDENEWLDAPEKEDEGEVVTEVLKEVEITDATPKDEKLRLLHTRYPEFEALANEFNELLPVFKEIQQQRSQGRRYSYKVANMKYRACAAYIAAIGAYISLFSSTSLRTGGKSLPLDPEELQQHTIMTALLNIQDVWYKVRDLKPPVEIPEESDEEVSEEIVEMDEDVEAVAPAEQRQTKRQKKQLAREAAAKKERRAREERMRAVEADLADLSSLVGKKPATSKSAKSAPPTAADDDSDFGEETTLSARSAAEKAARKKSLRFYTSQITQKASKRAGAGRDAGGDTDLPYRERLKDRQARLNAEAEKRGRVLDESGRGRGGKGSALDEADDEDDSDDALDNAKRLREEDDEYYDLITANNSAKRAAKSAKTAEFAQSKAAAALARVPEAGEDDVGDDGKRAIDRQILANKGLAQKRNKLNRNPRKKYREKYSSKMKKLGSVRAVYKPAEGPYAGEKTGIKAGLVKSVKL